MDDATSDVREYLEKIYKLPVREVDLHLLSSYANSNLGAHNECNGRDHLGQPQGQDQTTSPMEGGG
jgi:hypothetical protein